MKECTRCGTPLPDQGMTSIEPMECPSCGYLNTRPQDGSSERSLVENYFRDVFRIIVHPRLFFRHLPLQGGIGRPLAFALVTHWLGATFAFLWRLLLGEPVKGFFKSLLQSAETWVELDGVSVNPYVSQFRERIVEWFMGTGPIVADPFLTLFSILFTSVFVFIGARILVASGKGGLRDEVTFESAVRIICFGMTPSILSSFPLLGGMVASFWTAIVTIIGAKEVYRIGTTRATVVALFPKFLFFGIIGLGLFFMVFALMKFFVF